MGQTIPVEGVKGAVKPLTCMDIRIYRLPKSTETTAEIVMHILLCSALSVEVWKGSNR